MSNDFETRLTLFIEAITDLKARYYANLYADSPEGVNPPKFEFTVERGPKYARIVYAEPNGTGYGHRSAHCFIQLDNGDILKSSGWKTPEKKNPRGNIFNENILKGMTPHGTKYVR